MQGMTAGVRIHCKGSGGNSMFKLVRYCLYNYFQRQKKISAFKEILQMLESLKIDLFHNGAIFIISISLEHIFSIFH